MASVLIYRPTKARLPASMVEPDFESCVTTERFRPMYSAKVLWAELKFQLPVTRMRQSSGTIDIVTVRIIISVHLENPVSAKRRKLASKPEQEA
jgi:hypothetical protein